MIAPSGPLLEADHLARGVELCQALGYHGVLGQHAGSRMGYLAGTDQQRIDDINWALTAPDIDAVWCLRGGDGLSRIIDRVAFDAFASNPRIVMGYSDVTVLLIALQVQCGVVTFHAPMARFAMPEFSRRHFLQVLSQPVAPGRLGRITPPADVIVPERGRIVTVIPGRATGRLIGGNLTLLQSLIGTPWMPNLAGAILFLEDVNEDLYRIDRMLAHLRLAGALDGLAGVAIGHFSRMRRGTPDGVLALDEVLRHYFQPLGLPVAHGFPIGHVAHQWTLPLGLLAELDAGAGELTLLEAAVS